VPGVRNPPKHAGSIGALHSYSGHPRKAIDVVRIDNDKGRRFPAG
jgi:hypothetical protein